MNYTNFGGEKIKILYEEKVFYFNQDTKITIKGINKKDISKTLTENKDKFENLNGGLFLITSELSKLLK